MIRIVSGDLFNCKEDIIAHQVNCKGVAGGLAGVLFKRYPEAFIEYKQLLRSARDDSELLGRTFLTDPQDEDGKIIGNMFGQYNPGADYRPEAMYSALKECAELAETHGYSVALPYKISCGICGGDWDEVLALIERSMKNVRCTIYKKEDAPPPPTEKEALKDALYARNPLKKEDFGAYDKRFRPLNTDEGAEKRFRRPIMGERDF